MIRQSSEKTVDALSRIRPTHLPKQKKPRDEGGGDTQDKQYLSLLSFYKHHYQLPGARKIQLRLYFF